MSELSKEEIIEAKLTSKFEKALLGIIGLLAGMAITNLILEYFWGDMKTFEEYAIIILAVFTLITVITILEIWGSKIYENHIMKINLDEYELSISILKKLYKKDEISFAKMKKKAKVLKKCFERFLKYKEIKENNKRYKEQNIKRWEEDLRYKKSANE